MLAQSVDLSKAELLECGKSPPKYHGMSDTLASKQASSLKARQ
jgi:hypothetical protein